MLSSQQWKSWHHHQLLSGRPDLPITSVTGVQPMPVLVPTIVLRAGHCANIWLKLFSTSYSTHSRRRPLSVSTSATSTWLIYHHPTLLHVRFREPTQVWTTIGVTRGDNWWVSPFLAVVSSPLPYSHVVYPVFFLNWATKKIILGWVSPGVVHPPSAPPSDATGRPISHCC